MKYYYAPLAALIIVIIVIGSLFFLFSFSDKPRQKLEQTVLDMRCGQVLPKTYLNSPYVKFKYREGNKVAYIFDMFIITLENDTIIRIERK